MYFLPFEHFEGFIAHVRSAVPREGSGLLLEQQFKRHSLLLFVPCSHEDNTVISFRISDAAISRVVDSVRGTQWRVTGCAHSHNRGRAFPSPNDCATPKGTLLLWLIYSVRWRDLRLFSWEHGTYNQENLRLLP